MLDAARIGCPAQTLPLRAPHLVDGLGGFRAGAFAVPLNPDPYLFATLLAPNQPPLSGSAGVLDAQSLARARFSIPPGLPLAGLVVHHAFVVLDPDVRFASNPAPLRFIQ